MSCNVEYDLAIVGGGPAGSAAAIAAARRGIRVLVLERGGFPRHKVCGEFVSSESLQLLRDLLQRDPLLASAVAIERFCVYAASQQLEAAVVPHAAGISRYVLDATLMAAAQRSGADWRQEEVLQVEHGEHFTVHTTARLFTAKAVINASGRWSRLSPTQMPGRQSSFIGCKAHFVVEDAPSPNAVELFFGRDGYCGVQPVNVGDRTGLNVCAMLRPGSKSSMPAVLQLHPLLAQRSRLWQQCSPTVTTAPLFFRPERPVHGGVLQAGDAAAFIDPFVGDGIAIALRTGVMAGNAAARFCRGEHSVERCCAEYARGYREVVSPALRNAARLRRILSLPPAAQASLLGAMRTLRAGKWLLRATRSRVA
jgi:menaquinone-9 beta-reductase